MSDKKQVFLSWLGTILVNALLIYSYFLNENINLYIFLSGVTITCSVLTTIEYFKKNNK
ncbi:hypothetical protein BX659_1912 [Orenia metallireducens]|uniref:Uncharacterized protein n=1 Tax=Orenia metallireducens TaxID=1413210 RepID=A0A285IKB1_9FIRM|nr:hypothetical protein BX659_1912 [Orenia metallireducens]SNY48450.1 hypothetical protein SAMN06265827_1873 [Orenia metallireducens]